MALAFDEAFARELPALHRYLRRRVGSSAADDLTSETFAIAFARWDTFDQTRPLRPWLYGIASNLARHHYRAEARQLRAYARTGLDPVLDTADDSLSRASASAGRRALAAALAALRPQDREILLLDAWTELSNTEIAEALSLPIGTVKSRLHRLRLELRNRLGGGGQELDEDTAVPDGEAIR
ncbi:MAG: RNA polymerase sigma factor [Gaiellaceae bacterium]